MTAGTRSLRSVLSELLLVTVARSCGGGSSITDSSYRSRSSFFFSSPQLVRGLSFSCFDTRHTLARPVWSASWFFSPHPPSFICTPPVLVLIFHLRIVTRGWKNWTNHGKWKSASTKSVCSRVSSVREGVL